jgi:hypothetical protein
MNKNPTKGVALMRNVGYRREAQKNPGQHSFARDGHLINLLIYQMKKSLTSPLLSQSLHRS